MYYIAPIFGRIMAAGQPLSAGPALELYNDSAFPIQTQHYQMMGNPMR
ncbi:hypothetical protein RDI58_000397 [Solanum bulbocastanum]|uniref:Uncharacterized protein n=1 Tax=Solanum bulbocastanum TaxID=147425 RepID=A0AAN8UAC2_SOLBU